MMMILLALAGVLLSGIGTFAVRARARRLGILDMPNARSSHVIPTPRGGGVAFVAVVVFFTAVLALAGTVQFKTAVAVCSGGILLGGIGWIDDTRNVHPVIRLIIQFIAAWIAVSALPVSRIEAFGNSIDMGAAGLPIAVVGLVWLSNVFNFMDGIDAIAATQGAIASLIAGILLASGGVIGLAAIAVIVAGSLAGFMIWNWPPASIFMGDVGSSFIGFIVGVLALASEPTGQLGIFAVLTLVSPFLVDATITLLLRVSQGKQPWHAHREHLYQRLATQWGGHTKTTVTYGGVAVMAGLGTMAWKAHHTDGALPFVISVAILSALYIGVCRTIT